MAALDFPASPTNGQLYPAAPNAQYIYNATAGGPSTGAWESLPMESAKTITADVPPTTPADGDQWFNTLDGTLYVWVVDIDGGQWVESQAPITANGYYSPNYIINGDFGINQRGFTSTVTDGTYGFDRFKYEGAVGSPAGNITMSAQSFTAGTAPVAGYEAKNYLRLVTSGLSGGTVFASIRQPIEDVRTLAGQTATISFWAKAASGTPYIEPVFYQYFGTGGSSTVKTFGGKKALTTSWARYTFTVTLPSIAGTTSTANSSLSLYIFVADSGVIGTTLGLQNNTFDIWGVQVEEGSTATTFRRNANSVQGELAACQRYYWRRTGQDGSYSMVTTGFSPASNTTSLSFVFHNPVEMRALPTAIETSNLVAWDDVTPVSTFGSMSLNTNITNRYVTCVVATGGSGLTTYRPYALLTNNNTAGYIGVSAEL